MALALDEFGGIQGLVTLSDLIEAIVGEIAALGEKRSPEVVQREDGSWLLDGLLPVDELSRLFGLESLPGIQTAQFETLGGFIMASLGRIPAPGDYLDYRDLRFEVMDMDGFRVDKVLVARLPRTTT